MNALQQKYMLSLWVYHECTATKATTYAIIMGLSYECTTVQQKYNMLLLLWVYHVNELQ